MKRLAVLTKEYPSPGEMVYPFVEQLGNAMADEGVSVTVIAPTNGLRRRLHGLRALAERETRQTQGGRRVTILRPEYLSFGGTRKGPVNPAKWTLTSFERAARRALESLSEKPDALYAHFVFPSGLAAAKLGVDMGLPAFMAYGESTPKLFSGIPHDEVAGRLSALKGVIAVSGENARVLRDENYFADETRVGVFPNAVDGRVFYPRDRRAARRALGYPEDALIVAFVGGFIERKGVTVLSRALDETDALSVFIGRGEVRPDARRMLFSGPVDHDQIPGYLAAADLFALPTLNEGCCNAIVEALAMGLPVISSDRPFNDGLLTDENSIRVDPTDALAVAAAITRLGADGALRERLAEGARKTGAKLEIGARARSILSFMEERL